ncbi:MAG TPA: cell division FtsA domain-containing protein [Methylomusa anaerophila]|uniref:Cell division protein FtsA n=1 Tax=Methylomusa anaerophila TaxID=1930071 RepID=A0A348AGQ1_9FIRM|nr:cell division FtsA domain-containing protein [Methylomusa anaerophila]BBB90249.1 cell division protein FtsA [Methylomusa anaerophila]HML89404.1 cell division FtsA domain-containing protein [Methylomusa anaerophila]
MENRLLFALDIGTRSVVGLIGEQAGNSIKLLAFDREEHHTRAMLDGQIHDVREVAEVLGNVKSRLEDRVGPLKKVAVAAAGRALCTLQVTSEMDTSTRGTLTPEDERSLELAAIQLAQQQLATSNAVIDPASYYCVGYSVVSFTLDDIRLKSLVGQRGKLATIEAIATFLPRQVINSLQSAIEAVDLEMDTMTLEPIAAINVLIPATMRHLNLALVDVGAGTSDVAITRNGSVVGYGMVPFAGDEITEAISQKYLLDFNVSETLKRQLSGKNKKVSFTDVLGVSHKLPAKDIVDSITQRIGELAQAIATEILTLNSTSPQAVLLVGGGALTPLLPEALSQALDVPAAKVAIRRPDSINDIIDIPAELCTPDAVTPLGILKLAGGDTLNFVNVTVNDRTLRLFNLSLLTVSDALLSAGIDIKALRGRPGMGITVTVNGQTQFIPGSYGKPGQVLLNGEEAKLADPLHDTDVILVTPGTNGASPAPVLNKIAPIPEPLVITLNGKSYSLPPAITVNGKSAAADTILADRDQVIINQSSTLAEVLSHLGLSTEPAQFSYSVNRTERNFSVRPKYAINGHTVNLSSKVANNDSLDYIPLPTPTIGEVLELAAAETDESITVAVNGAGCQVPVRRHSVQVNGKPASLTHPAPNGCVIDYNSISNFHPIVSDALLAADFNPRTLSPSSRVAILLNGHPTEYTAVIKNGDSITIQVSNPK